MTAVSSRRLRCSTESIRPACRPSWHPVQFFDGCRAVRRSPRRDRDELQRVRVLGVVADVREQERPPGWATSTVTPSTGRHRPTSRTRPRGTTGRSSRRRPMTAPRRQVAPAVGQATAGAVAGDSVGSSFRGAGEPPTATLSGAATRVGALWRPVAEDAQRVGAAGTTSVTWPAGASIIHSTNSGDSLPFTVGSVRAVRRVGRGRRRRRRRDPTGQQ